MKDRAVAGRQGGSGHAFALALALLLAAPLVTMAVVTTTQYPGGGRMLAVMPPWTPDAEALAALAGLGAVWAVPLQVPGMWLVERSSVVAQAPRVVLIPIADGWSSSFGCAVPLPISRR